MNIGFAGDGAGAIVALESLQNRFGSIEVLSSDTHVNTLIRKEDACVRELEDFTAGLVICAGYKSMIPKGILQARKFINVHYSLLPKYRGMHSTVWAIMNDEKRHGLTIHMVNEYMDDGPILAQYDFDIVGKTSLEVMMHCHTVVKDKLGGVIVGMLEGAIQPLPQDKSAASWVPRRNRNDCVIDFACDCASLRNFFRALVRPYPLPMLKIEGQIYEVADATIYERNYNCTIGRVVNMDEEGAWIKIADGLLVVKMLEISGEKILPHKLLKAGQRL